jgi:hypothetical protein
MIDVNHIHPTNVSTFSGQPLADIMVGSFWIEVLKNLRTILGKRFDSYRFLFYTLTSYQEPADFSSVEPDTILIVLSDNSQRHYLDHFKRFKAVFKVHMCEQTGNVFPVPLGYTIMHLRGCQKSFEQRESNVFYSGNINAFRVDLWRALRFKNPIPRKNIKHRLTHRGLVYSIRKLKLQHHFDSVFPDSYIRFTTGFATGMGAEEYTHRLATSKIALSPHGFWRAECFRHFEAMRSGNVIISDKLPDTWYFKDSPIIQIEHWSQLRGVVNTLLSDGDRLVELQTETIAWWNQKCSPRAVALYIASKLV